MQTICLLCLYYLKADTASLSEDQHQFLCPELVATPRIRSNLRIVFT